VARTTVIVSLLMFTGVGSAHGENAIGVGIVLYF
jgi:hypothetical protein